MVGAGYDEAALWRLTPRQLLARLKLARRRKRHELGAQLSIAALGARGDEKELRKQLKRLNRE